MPAPADARDAGSAELAALVDATLRLTWLDGEDGEVESGYSIGWRAMPFAVLVQWTRQPILFETVGHPPRRLRPGQALIIPAGLRHRSSVIGQGPAGCRWAHVQASVLGTHDLIALLAPDHVQPVAVGVELGELCAGLAAVPRTGLALAAVARRQALAARLLELLIRLGSAPDGWLDALGRAARVQPALRHIDAHWREPLDSRRLARLAGLSRSRFHAVFRAAMGLGPIAYLRRRRIDEAQRLLVAGDLPVAVIAEQVGFPDAFHFSRVFKAACGASPVAFRRAVRLARPGAGGA
jgi:AraC-like DNA-binding protein